MSDSHSQAHDLRGLPTGELLKRLTDDTGTLVQQELELAKAEVTETAKEAGVGVGQLGAAGIVAMYALGALTVCAIAALALVLRVWLAALIVAAVYAIAALILALLGRNRLRQAVSPALEQTQQTMKENVEWLQDRTRSGTR
jgi:ABC-type multidrug transport system fused ATPase/permease subunit